MKKVAKFVVAFLAAAAVTAVAAISDNTITPAEWLAIAVAGLGAVGVYVVPNKPAEPEAVQAVRAGRSGL